MTDKKSQKKYEFEFGKHRLVIINKSDIESSISVNPYLGKTKRTKRTKKD